MFFVRQLLLRNEICYQTKNFQACFQALSRKVLTLSKFSPVTLHYSPATAILNETPGFKSHILVT